MVQAIRQLRCFAFLFIAGGIDATAVCASTLWSDPGNLNTNGLYCIDLGIFAGLSLGQQYWLEKK